MIHDKWRMVLLQYQSAKAEWISFSYKRDNLKVVEVTSKSFDLVTSHSHLPAPPLWKVTHTYVISAASQRPRNWVCYTLTSTSLP